MSFTPDAFKKATGVDLDADTPTMLKGLANKVKATTQSQIATALIVRTLIVEHSFNVTESAEAHGLSVTAASLAGKRGQVMWETGPDSILPVWNALQVIPSKALTALVETLQGMTTPADRVAYVVRLGVSTAVSVRLGENATPKRIDDMTNTLMSEGHRSPVAAKKAAAGIAKRLNIPLPVAKRPGTASGKADSKADIPTFDATGIAFLEAIRKAVEGADEDNPVMLTAAQSKIADDVMQALAALIDVAKVAVPA